MSEGFSDWISRQKFKIQSALLFLLIGSSLALHAALNANFTVLAAILGGLCVIAITLVMVVS